MPVVLIGGGPSMPVDRQKFRYHITWCFLAASVVPDSTLGTHHIAGSVQSALAPLGLVPVSPVAAITGDPFIQFTVQVGMTGPGAQIVTLADIVEAADKLPLFSGGVSLRVALDVCEVEVRSAGLSNEIVRAQNAVARQRAFDNAKARDISTKVANAGAAIGDAVKGAAGATGNKLDEYLKKLFGGLADIAKFALGMGAIIGIVYVVVRYRQ